MAGTLRLGPTTDVKRKFSTEAGFRGKAQPDVPQTCPWAASVARSSWGSGIAWRRAHGWPSCSASPKVRTTLCQFQRGKQTSPSWLGSGAQGAKRERERGEEGGWGKRDARPGAVPGSGPDVSPRGVTGLTAIKEELLGRQKAGGGAERRFHLPRAEGAGARGAGGAHCVGRSGGAGCLEAGCDWWSKAGRVGAARHGSPRARAPLARAVRLHRGRRTQPGPARAPRAGCARLAATWRVSGWSRSSSVFAPLRFLLLVLLLLLSPNPPHHPGLCAASFPGFRGTSPGKAGAPAAFNLTLRLRQHQPGRC